MNKHWNYFKYILKHKYYCFIECWKLGIPWRGIVHDLSKFRPCEWFPYVEYFYGGEHETMEQIKARYAGDVDAFMADLDICEENVKNNFDYA
jgi:hypothetical protein